MYFNVCYVEKIIVKECFLVFDMGNLVYVLVLQLENFEVEFSVELEIFEGVFIIIVILCEFIDVYNVSLLVLLSVDDIKVLLEEYNVILLLQMLFGVLVDEIYVLYEQFFEEFQCIENGIKYIVMVMKVCIKEYNVILFVLVKISGSCDVLLE